MNNIQNMIDQSFLEMRGRCLSLAADFDRLDRASGGSADWESNAYLHKLREAMKLLLEVKSNRTEQVLMLFSDTTPSPHFIGNPKSKVQNLK